jgi:hypothetical protein
LGPVAPVPQQPQLWVEVEDKLGLTKTQMLPPLILHTEPIQTVVVAARLLAERVRLVALDLALSFWV